MQTEVMQSDIHEKISQVGKYLDLVSHQSSTSTTQYSESNTPTTSQAEIVTPHQPLVKEEIT